MKPKSSITKPAKIVILQWLFLIITLIAYAITASFGILTFNVNYWFELLTIYLPILMLSAITICLFMYTKRSMLFVTPFAIILVLTIIYWLQYFYLSVYLAFLGLSLSDLKVSPNEREFMVNHSLQAIRIFNISGLSANLLEYGIPVFLIYIFHKLTRYK